LWLKRRWDNVVYARAQHAINADPATNCVDQAANRHENRRIFKISETQPKFADNSFRNGKFRVPIQSETRPERERNAQRDRNAGKQLCKARSYTGTRLLKVGLRFRRQSSVGSGCDVHFCLRQGQVGTISLIYSPEIQQQTGCYPSLPIYMLRDRSVFLCLPSHICQRNDHETPVKITET
jgi:hypothetical protein